MKEMIANFLNRGSKEKPANGLGQYVASEIKAVYDQWVGNLEEWKRKNKVYEEGDHVLHLGTKRVGRKLTDTHRQTPPDSFDYEYFFIAIDEGTNQRTVLESIGNHANFYTETEDRGVRVEKVLEATSENISRFLAEMPRPIDFNAITMAQERARVEKTNQS